MSGCEEWQTVKSKQRPRRRCYIEDTEANDKSDEFPATSEPTMEIHGEGGPTTTPWVRSAKEFQHAYGTPEGKALQQAKHAIQEETKWDDFKKITNPYEYVFLSWNRRSSRSVSTRQPLSRSYFKMIELWKQAGLTQEIAQLVARDTGLKTAHAAEGPGGFIEACWEQGKRAGWTTNQTDAITLRSDARNIPGWRKASRFLAERPQIHIHEGADGTGDILKRINQDAFVDVAKGAHIYTADGGFDFSSDYDAQEDSVFPLLLAEFLIGLQVLTPGGCLVIKCFDTLEIPTMDLLWIASRCFREWSLVKPKTSRAGNAERYFVGKGRLSHIEDSIAFLQAIQSEKRWIAPLVETNKAIHDWRQSILTFQERIEHQEYEIIRKTLDLIHAHDFPRIRSLVRDNIRRSLEWCREHGEPYSMSWVNDMERNVTKETQDLLHIISPTNLFATGTKPIFGDFRTDAVEAVYRDGSQ
jgi:23S rRNA U2552 (ribose-2'-O)-methylase RlmE/FtsJ